MIKTPHFFKNQEEFRAWLEANSEIMKELMVGYYKVNTGKPSMTWPESVDQAICFGWIDGIRKSIDDESYCIRFTPRNPKSNWSQVNIKKVEQLLAKGLMTAKGIELFENRIKNDEAEYSYENKPLVLPTELMNMLKCDKTAFKYFENQSDSYKRTAFFWILSAKQEKTKISRMEKLIERSKNQQHIF